MSRKFICVTEHVDVDVVVDVSDLDDDEIMGCVEEARTRGLLDGVGGSLKDRLRDLYEDLVANRTGKAVEKFEHAFFCCDEVGLADCYRALREGCWGTAICILDGIVYERLPLKRFKPTAPGSASPDSVKANA